MTAHNSDSTEGFLEHLQAIIAIFWYSPVCVCNTLVFGQNTHRLVIVNSQQTQKKKASVETHIIHNLPFIRFWNNKSGTHCFILSVRGRTDYHIQSNHLHKVPALPINRNVCSSFVSILPILILSKYCRNTADIVYRASASGEWWRRRRRTSQKKIAGLSLKNYIYKII